MIWPSRSIVPRSLRRQRGFLLNPFRFGGGPLTCDAADFSGTDYFVRTSDLTGNADGKKGMLSSWIRLDGGDATRQRIFTSLGAFFLFERTAANRFRILGANAGAATILDLRTAAIYTAGAAWLHLLYSWDLGGAGSPTSDSHWIYVNDVLDTTNPTAFVNDTVQYTRTTWSVGGDTLGNELPNMCMGELAIWFGESLDLSDVNNRRKFIGANGKPINLGGDGSAVTGNKPIVYLHLDDGEPAANFAINRGSGGNFTPASSVSPSTFVATASTSPSD